MHYRRPGPQQYHSKYTDPNLDLLPAHIDLVGAEIEMITYRAVKDDEKGNTENKG